MILRNELTWDFFTQECPLWLEDVLTIPSNARPPLAMTPPHPRATGSYGPEAVAWIEQELKRELPKGLRWWQKLAIFRQLEHDADGKLVWKLVLESTPRRSGKSVRLRAMALWRVAHPELFEDEAQIALHTGRDVAIVREIHRKAWRWATERYTEGWSVSRGVGQEEVINDTVNRWLVRSNSSVYGYDVTLGMVDESWDVPVEVFSEGLEPGTLERISPQLLLTSTAHRRATSLMPAKLTAALEAEDDETLLLLWAAPEGADAGDPQVWQEASPHWSADRATMLGKKYATALRGESDPELDDLDPMMGFRSQYLNQWIFRVRERPAPGRPVVTEAEWADILGAVPPGPPDSVAIEAWFADGLVVVQAWNRSGIVTVSATHHPNAAQAAAHAGATGVNAPIRVGKSLVVAEPLLRALWHEPMSGTTALAVKELGRLVGEGTLRHDGGDELTAQVMALRVQPSPDGPRLVSKHRADGVKALSWAVAAAKEAPETAQIF